MTTNERLTVRLCLTGKTTRCKNIRDVQTAAYNKERLLMMASLAGTKALLAGQRAAMNGAEWAAAWIVGGDESSLTGPALVPSCSQLLYWLCLMAGWSCQPLCTASFVSTRNLPYHPAPYDPFDFQLLLLRL